MIQTARPIVLEPQAAKPTSDWAHTANLLCCRIDPTGRFVFAGAIDHTIQRWELATGKKTPLVGHRNWVRMLGFSPDGEALYSVSFDGRLLTWDTTAEAPAPVKEIGAHQGWVRGVAVSHDGHRVATCGNDKLVKVWSARDGKLIREHAGHPAVVYCVQFVPGSDDLVSGDIVGNICHWKAEDARMSRAFDLKEIHSNIGKLAPFGGIISLAFSGDGKTLTASGLHKVSNAPGGNRRPVAVSIDWATGEKRPKYESLKKEVDGTMWRVLHHPAGALIGVFEKQIGFWTPGAPDATHLAATPSDIFDCDLHPNQLDLYTAHFDGHLRGMRIGRGEPMK
ncbi:MAG: WD40 repeat domain-containing protein [Gemmata sp.]